MKNWTFGQQFAVLLGIAVVCSILSFVTRIGWFHNLGWLLYGLLFLAHPVWPRSWDYAGHDKLRLGCRIGGGLMILVALVTRFGV